MSTSLVSTPQALASTSAVSPLRSTPIITEPQITLPSSVSSRSPVLATGSTASTPLASSNRTVGDILRQSPRSATARQTPVGTLTRTSVAGTPSVRMTKSAPKTSPPSLRSRTPVITPISAPVDETTPAESTPLMTVPSSVVQTPSSASSEGSLVTPQQAAALSPGLRLPTILPRTSVSPTRPSSRTPSSRTPSSRAPSSRTPSSRTPSSRTPSSRTPASRTPSSRTPSSRTPSSRTPAPRTASPQRQGLPLPSSPIRSLSPLSPTAASPSGDLSLPVVVPSAVRTPVSSPVRSPVRTDGLTLPSVRSAVSTPSSSLSGGLTLPSVRSPVRTPVVSPVRTGGLTLPTVRSPVRTPVTSPVRSSVVSPVRTGGLTLPTVRSPVSSPVRTPVVSPVRTPVVSPVRSPVSSPARSGGLTLPTVRSPVRTGLTLPSSTRTPSPTRTGGLPLPSVRSPVRSPLPSVRSPISAPVRSPVTAPVRSPLSRTGGLSLPVRSTASRTGLTRPASRPSLRKPSVTMVKKTQEASQLDDLINHGFLIEHRLYHEGALSHLLVRTIRGDLAFLKVDNQLEVPSSFSGTDLTMDKKTTITLVPHETKLTVLQCLDTDLCGAAFVCDDHVCITEKTFESEELKFKEETFSLRGNGQLVGGRIGRSLLAHPVVPLSQALFHPVEVQIMIANAAMEIAEKAFHKLDKFQESLDQAVERLDQKVHALKDLTQMVHESIDKDLQTLTDVQAELLASDDSDEIRALRTQVSDSLHKKKLLRMKIINALAASHGMTGMIESLTNEIEQLSTPVLSEFVANQGQA